MARLFNQEAPRRMCHGHPPGFAIIGPFRSGTSLVSSILAGLGVDLGPRLAHFPTPDRYNPLGYFQLPEIIGANTHFIMSASGTLFQPGHPELLVKNGNHQILASLDLSWRNSVSPWAIKDPRLCATLAAWIAARCFDPENLKIVRVVRPSDHVAKSILKHYEIRNYCNNDIDAATIMTETYDKSAAWHETNTNIPCCRINYQTLVKNPTSEIRRLADYVGVQDQAKIERCIKLIGKRKALARHYAKKLTNSDQLTSSINKTVKSWTRRNI